MQGTSDQQLAPGRQSKLMDTEDAAQYIGVTTRTLEVWRCTKRHAIPYIKVGRLVRYRCKDLDCWLESRTVDAVAGKGVA
jgi:excisionase family DNA binding protein